MGVWWAVQNGGQREISASEDTCLQERIGEVKAREQGRVRERTTKQTYLPIWAAQMAKWVALDFFIPSSDLICTHAAHTGTMSKPNNGPDFEAQRPIKSAPLLLFLLSSSLGPPSLV